MKKKIIQVPVIVGKGSAQFFVEKDVTISPPSPPIFKIEDIKKKVFIIDAHVIPGKVIFNAKIWKNVVYKTVEDVCDGVVNGPLFHSTFEIFFGGFVEMDPVGCEKVKEGDVAELLEAFVEGEKDFLHCEDCIKGVTVFKKLLEKDVVKVAFKVVRTEHLVVCSDEEKKEEEKKCIEEKCEDRCDDKRDDKRDDKWDWEDKRDKDDKWDKRDDRKEDKREDKKDDNWEKRYDVRGDYYAKCRGKY
jgi:hypothetical protein